MRRTRVIATVGPASWDIDSLSSMFEAGANVFRLNYSHGVPEDKTEIYERIRSLESEGKTTCILADLPGPKLRLGEFPDQINLVEGQIIKLLCGLKYHDGEELPVEYGGLSKELKVGDSVLIADGLIQLSVVKTSNEENSIVECEVIDGGIVSSRKGINVPSTTVNLPAIGEKDKLAIAHAIENNADWIAVSYVRTADDIKPAKAAIKEAGKHTPVIAKSNTLLL